MDLENLTKAALTLGTPLIALVGVANRRKRKSGKIKEDLDLLRMLKESPACDKLDDAAEALVRSINFDVRGLVGQPERGRRKPIPWGAVVLAIILGVPTGIWTWRLNHSGFVWYSIFPGTFALLMAVSVIGQFTNREVPADAETRPTR